MTRLLWYTTVNILPTQQLFLYIGGITMNWFQKHLNWTWVFGVLLFQVLAFFLAVIGVSEVTRVVGIFVGFFLSGWVILQKGRNISWVLLSGVLSPLWLSNKAIDAQSKTQNSQIQSSTTASTYHAFCPMCGSESLPEDKFCGECGTKLVRN